MREFIFHIEDERYAVLTEALVVVRDETRAREIAEKRLSVSPHFISIAVHERGELLFTVTREPGPL